MSKSRSGFMRVLLASLMVLIFILPVISYAMPGYTQQTSIHTTTNTAWMLKFHPALLSKVLSGEIKDQDTITVLFRLQGPPTGMLTLVKGHHTETVNLLKNWAKESQAPFIKKVVENGGQVLNTFWIDNLVLVKAKLSTIKKLAADPQVVQVFENFPVHVLDANREGTSVQPRQGTVESWGIFKIGAPEAWKLGYTGEGVRIAVLDTGVDITHPALQGKMLTLDPNSPYYPGGWMEFDENGNPVLSQPHDTEGHGTHVSGTALGGNMQNILIGVAPGATLMHGLVLPGGGGTFAEVLAGIQWAVDPFYIDPNTGQIVYTNLPAHVISMSLGASNYYGDELLPGIQAALLANIVVVAAIGNDGPGTSSNPGNIWGVFGVGATDQNDQVASFSSGEVVNWPNPPSTWPFYGYYPSQYIKPDFSAPGVQITSSVPGGGYATWDGTSMATPHVSGTVALILQAAGWNVNPVPNLPERVYEILKNASIDLGEPGQDTRYGWGRINATQAVLIAEQYAKQSGVEGRVLDKVNGEPIKWAQVTVLEINKTFGVLPDGSFKIPLDPGTYHLVFNAWGYMPVKMVVNVTLFNGTVAGQVYNALTGAPIPGALVTLSNATSNITVVTDANGTFSVSVKPDAYQLVVYATGYKPYVTSVLVKENETVFLNIPLTPSGNGTVEGYVFDTNGTPVADAIVFVQDMPTISAVTNSTGYYNLTGVPAGLHVIVAWKNGYTMDKANVTVQPNMTVTVNFTLTPLPPSVVIIGDIMDHEATVISDGLNSTVSIVTYSNVTGFLQAWLMEGSVFPAVVVVDHWRSDKDLPSWDVLEEFLLATKYFRVPLVLLDTSYTGVTGVGALEAYYSNVTMLGFPAPAGMVYDYPDAKNVTIEMLNASSPLFQGVVPDNDSWFYLADVNNSNYADYIFFEDWSQPIQWVGNITDNQSNMTGRAVGIWTDNETGETWIILSSWAESVYMQYIVSGFDGVYSNNTARVLVNAVRLALNESLGTPLALQPKSIDNTGFISRIFAASTPPVYRIDKYTNVTVYMDRLPYGYIEGTLKGNDGQVLSHANITVVGTPVKVQANANGYFKTWLPAGNYTLEIYKPGYAKTYVNVTVKVNKTTDLGVLVLERVPRIAILYDYNGELANLIIENLGWYAKDFDNVTEFANALNDTFFDAGIWAGYYLAPFPMPDEFQAVMAAINTTGKSVIFMDQWDNAAWYPQYFGYGIRALNVYTGDPAKRITGDNNGPVYIKITGYNPIFAGYKVGDLVKILEENTQGYGTDFAAFQGFTGETLAQLYLNKTALTPIGDAVAYKMLPNGAKIILMASWAPEEYQDIQWWTQDMVNIFLNAVVWEAAKQVNMTPSIVEAHVGDKVSFQASGFPANYTVAVSLDGKKIAVLATDAEGNLSFTLTVPTIPGGNHTIFVEGHDKQYYAMATLIVTAKISVAIENVTVPASVAFNITGLPAETPVSLFLDSNYLGSLKSDVNGTATGVVNLPFVSDGVHKLIVRDLDYNKLACIKVYTTSSLESLLQGLNQSATNLATLNAKLSQLEAMVNQMNTSIYYIVKTSTGQVVAIVKSQTGALAVKLDDVKDMVTANMTMLESMLEKSNATLYKLIETKSGELYALVNTSKGEVLVKIENSNKQTLDELARIQQNLQNTMAVNTNKILTAINQLQQNLNQTMASLQQQVTQETSTAKSRANTGLGVGTAALAVSLAGIALVFTRKF